MNEELAKKIIAMAETLGTTVEHLWGVLLKQAAISGSYSVFLVIFTVIPLVFWIRYVYKKTCVEDQDGDCDWEGEGAGVAWAVTVFWFLVVLFVVGFALQNAVTAFFNPEFWALQAILH